MATLDTIMKDPCSIQIEKKLAGYCFKPPYGANSKQLLNHYKDPFTLKCGLEIVLRSFQLKISPLLWKLNDLKLLGRFLKYP